MTTCLHGSPRLPSGEQSSGKRRRTRCRRWRERAKVWLLRERKTAMRRQRLRNYFGKEVDFRLLCEGDSSLLESCFAPITTYYFKSSTTGPETGSVTPSSRFRQCSYKIGDNNGGSHTTLDRNAHGWENEAGDLGVDGRSASDVDETCGIENGVGTRGGACQALADSE